MKLFGSMFIHKDYATLPKLETFLVKELGKHGYDVRRDADSSFIISSDRADVMTIKFRMFRRSFDFWTTDAFGNQMTAISSYRGDDWRRFMKTEMKNILWSLHTAWVPDNHVINSKWNQMLQEIAYTDIPAEWEGVIITPAFKELMSK